MINTPTDLGNTTLMNIDHMERTLAQLSENELKVIFAITFNLIDPDTYKLDFLGVQGKNEILETFALKALKKSSLKVLRIPHGKNEDGKLVFRVYEVVYKLGGDIAVVFKTIHDTGFGFTYNPKLTQAYIEVEHPETENLPLLDSYIASIPLKKE